MVGDDANTGDRRATTPTSRPSCTPRTATPTRTCKRRTARSASRPRWRRASRRRSLCPDDAVGSRRTARAASTSPTTRDLIQAEFEKNIPFALAVAESAKDPDDPVSVVGRDAEDFRVDSFSVSYGDPQTVAVCAKRDLLAKLMVYRINGGPVEALDGQGVEGRRALRCRERRLLRRVPRHGEGDEGRRQCGGVVHRQRHRTRPGRRTAS